jgi:hypothetical protein
MRSSHHGPHVPLPWIKSRVATARDDGRKRIKFARFLSANRFRPRAEALQQKCQQLEITTAIATMQIHGIYDAHNFGFMAPQQAGD